MELNNFFTTVTVKKYSKHSFLDAFFVSSEQLL